jgi:EmrB/QacA subfamily drug resistance transporter
MHGSKNPLRELAPDHVLHQREYAKCLTLLTLCTGVLIAQIDTSVVILGIRPIGTYFHAGVSALQWVVDSYNLLYAILLLSGGLLADIYGRRLVFITGAGLFTAASLLCALAPSVSILIGGRALAGIGAALLLPASLAIIRVVWSDAEERGRALGIWASCNGVALAIGPTLGGLLIDWFGWRSIFLIVVPIGLAAVALALPTIPESSDPQGRHFDALAQILGAVTLGGVALAAIEAQNRIGISATALATAAGSFVLFLRVEKKRGTSALVPLDLFGVREFGGAIAATAGMTFGMYGTLFLLPLTWQSTGRLDPVSAGIALMPMAVTFMAVSPFSGRLTSKIGARLPTSGGVSIIGCGLLLIGLTAHGDSIAAAEIGVALTGLGMGFATGPLMGLAVGSVARERSGTAAALINVARMAGATFGVAMLGALFMIAHGGADGLRAAMLLGSAVQLTSAAVAWRATRASKALVR